MSTTLQQWQNGQVNPEVIVNENFATLSHMGTYAMRPAATSGLVWAWYGGRWGGFTVADGQATLSASATHYMTVDRATGAVAVATTNTAWNNTTDHARVYRITTGSTTVTEAQDHRGGPAGVHGQADLGSLLALIDALDARITALEP